MVQKQELRIALINELLALPSYQMLRLLVMFYINRVLAARIGLQLKINYGEVDRSKQTNLGSRKGFASS